jgi:hypothetical protein
MTPDPIAWRWRRRDTQPVSRAHAVQLTDERTLCGLTDARLTVRPALTSPRCRSCEAAERKQGLG